jgi:phosphopantetheine adenylyltransferase
MKKFSLLYTNGSSHTKGGGLEEPLRREDSCLPLYEKKYNTTWNNRDEVSWPSRLANMMDIDLVNESECGGGLSRVVRMTFDFIFNNWDKKDNMLIILEIPGGVREDIWFNPLESYMIVNSNLDTDDDTIFVSSTREYHPLNKNQIKEESEFENIFKIYLLNFYNHEERLHELFKSILSLYSFCKQNNIEIILQELLHDFYEIPQVNLFDKTDIFGMSIDRFARKNKMMLSNEVDFQDGHPGYFGHIEYATKIFEFIKDKYNFNDQKRI